MWDGVPNFGDDLTSALLPGHGIAPDSCRPEDANFAGVGSILEMLPRSFSGHVWGSGLMHDKQMQPFEKTPQFHAVRGALTRDRLGLSDAVPLGDPGLLIDQLVRAQPRKRFRLAVVPHYVHIGDDWVLRFLRDVPEATWVNVQQPPHRVAQQIAEAEFVISSSLHGLITADALAIPAAWVQIGAGLNGGDFKFRDHETAIWVKADVSRQADPADSFSKISAHTRTPDVAHLETIKDRLKHALGPILRDTSLPRRNPLLLPFHRA